MIILGSKIWLNDKNRKFIIAWNSFNCISAGSRMTKGQYNNKSLTKMATSVNTKIKQNLLKKVYLQCFGSFFFIKFVEFHISLIQPWFAIIPGQTTDKRKRKGKLSVWAKSWLWDWNVHITKLGLWVWFHWTAFWVKCWAKIYQ